MPDVSRNDFKGALLPFFMPCCVVYRMGKKVSYNSPYEVGVLLSMGSHFFQQD